MQIKKFLVTTRVSDMTLEALAKRPHGPGSAGVLACPCPV